MKTGESGMVGGYILVVAWCALVMSCLAGGLNIFML
jgi:hypothetical protein